MSITQQTLNRAQASVMQNYGRAGVVMVRGQGCYLWDTDGKQYLDLFAGFGGSVLGHAHPALVEAVTRQAQDLWHVGNALWTLPQIEFAERLKAHAFDGRAFFCHSGLEANEAAVKLARLYGMRNGSNRWKTISFLKSFHGRSLAMIAATGNPAVKEGFGPPVPGFTNVDPLDWDSVLRSIDDQTCAIIMEPVQGEGGINLYPPGYLKKVRQLCDERDLVLIFDEVWTGCGRTGRWFAYQHEDVVPDIMTLGKAVGGGLPVGVMYARTDLAGLFTPGRHGCTLGGNPICMAVSRTIFDLIEKENLLEHASALGERAVARLRKASSITDKVQDVRGRGLFLGIELRAEPIDFINKSLAAGLITNLTSKKVIRLAPPINISESLWDEGIDRLIRLIESV
ncbi:MAG: acetylornithine aminotransferase [Phycisphaerae bacterium]|jgi:predicted acetylornithine/succinylornithine family transaminase|nr:MAG: acetylornithine aminotransferase [Phycisphaerae bacterium]